MAAASNKKRPFALALAALATIAGVAIAYAVIANTSAPNPADTLQGNEPTSTPLARTEPSTRAAAPEVTATAPVPTPTPKATDNGTSTPTASPGAKNDSATRFAFVRSVEYGKPGTIVVDYAEYLTGQAATKAARKRNNQSALPNDYYIVNDDTKTTTLKLSPNASVRLVTSSDGTSDPAGYESDVERWTNQFAAPSEENAAIRSAGYWITVENGLVTAVREQFAP